MFHTLIARTIQFTVLAKVVHAVPPIWGLISDKLFKVHAVGGNGANFVSPDAKVSASVGAVGFVDDTTETILSLMVDKATKDGMMYWRSQAGRWKSPNASYNGLIYICCLRSTSFGPID
jgi:hypothetical protein